MKRKNTVLLLTALVCLMLTACGKSSQSMQAEESPATPNAVYDRSVYEAASQAVREEYIQVIQGGIESFEETAHPEIPLYTALLTRFPENRYYEGYFDFDGNGVPEMVVAIGSEIYTPVKPVAVYAFDGQSMRYLCKDHPLGERSFLSFADGLFVVHGSGGASSGILALYRIADDGWSTEIADVIHYEYSDAEHVTYTSEYGRISSEEVVNRGLADPLPFGAELDWICFYPPEQTLSVPGMWQTASMSYIDDGNMAPEYYVWFTDSEIVYGHLKDGTSVFDHSDQIVSFEELETGRFIIQAQASNGVKYSYRTSESDPDVLEYYETWNEDSFSDMYRGGASLSRSS